MTEDVFLRCLAVWSALREQKRADAWRAAIEMGIDRYGVKRLMCLPDIGDEECAEIVVGVLNYYGTGPCPRCGSPIGPLKRKNKRGLYVCRNQLCRHQFSALSLTSMRGTRVPIRLWFSIANKIDKTNGDVTTHELAKLHGLKHDTVKRMRCVIVATPVTASLRTLQKGVLGGKNPVSIRRRSKRQKMREGSALFDSLNEAQKEQFAGWVLEPEAEMEHAFWTIVMKWAYQQRGKLPTKKKDRG